MKISDIISFYRQIDNNTDATSIAENILNQDITKISDNTKDIDNSSIFVAVVGEKFNGVDFIDEAFKKGAILVIAPSYYKEKISYNNVLFVKNSRDFLARATFFFHKDYIPQNILTVSGTNGKSSVSFFVSQFLNCLEVKNLVIGTLGIYIDGQKTRDCLTTPNPLILCEYLEQAQKQGINYVVMESSSHGIEQHRMDGLNFVTAGFTNLTQDHLDYHKTMDNYFIAKSRLYTELNTGNSVINVDDEWGVKLKELCTEHNKTVLDYGLNANAGLQVLSILKYDTSQEVAVKYEDNEYNVVINLMGEFQVYNILCAIGMLLSCGFKIEDLVSVSSQIKEVEGRLNLVIPRDKYLDYKIFVDFAHTPNALEEVLKMFKKENHHKLHVLFGCGGNRDKTKREIMGRIASEYADYIYITDDNPRFEDPKEIRAEVEKGVKRRSGLEVYNIDDRAKAIKQAISSLNKGDILLVAGKGHEKSQIIGDKVIDFSDKEEILKVLDKND